MARACRWLLFSVALLVFEAARLAGAFVLEVSPSPRPLLRQASKSRRRRDALYSEDASRKLTRVMSPVSLPAVADDGKDESNKPQHIVVVGARPGATTLASEVEAAARKAGLVVTVASETDAGGDQAAWPLGCGVIDLLSCDAASASRVTAKAEAADAASYVMVSCASAYARSELFGDAAVAATAAVDEASPFVAAERVARECAVPSVVLLRAPRLLLPRLGFDDQAEMAPLFRYIFDRVIARSSFIPLPFEWRQVPLTMAREADVAEIAVKALLSARAGLSSKDERLTLNAGGTVHPDLSLTQPYALPALCRAAAVSAGLARLKTVYFLLDSPWLSNLNFPADLSSGGLTLDANVTEEVLLLGDEANPKKKTRKPSLGRRVFPEREKKAEEAEADLRLVAAVALTYDAYLARGGVVVRSDDDETKNPFADDDELVMDGDSLGGSMVYINDEFHFPLGTPRDDNPKLALAAAHLSDVRDNVDAAAAPARGS